MASHLINVLFAITPVFIIVILGLWLRKKEVIGNEVDKGLTTLLINVLMPCFILDNIIGSQVASDLPNVLTLAALGAGIIIISLAVVYFLTPLLGMREGAGRRSFTVAAGIQNYGFMVVPLMMSLFNDKELLATLFLHNLGAEIAIYTVAIMIFSGKLSLNPRVLLKAPVLAVVVGVMINVSQLAPLLPTPALTAIQMVGNTAVPLALLAIGMSIAEVLPETKFSLKVSFAGVAMRLLLLPVIILSIAYFLPLEIHVKKVLLMQAAMPAALFPIVLARHYGGKPSLVAEVIVVKSILSFVTMPFIVTYGSKLLGI